MFIKGLYTVVVTPFTDEDELDEAGLRQNLRFQMEAGVDGIVMLGTTGEDPTLTRSEKERVIQIGLEEIKGKIPLLIGTGSYSTRQAIENTRLAKQLGANGALIVTPYYNKPTQEGLYQHFKAICEAVDLPICIYNIQGRTGQNLQTDTLKRLINLPNIVSVKEASGNLAQIDEVIQTVTHTHQHFSILSGDDALTLPLMTLGGHGIFSVVSNLIPKQVKALVDACIAGRFDLARQLHFEMTPLFKGAFLETNPIPIKAAMQMCGKASGRCRLPLCDLLPENREKLRRIIDELPKHWLT